MAKKLHSIHSGLSVGVVAGGVSIFLATRVLGQVLKRWLRIFARKSATSHSQYHLAVHLAGSTTGSRDWVLVKCHKAGDLQELLRSTAEALDLEAAEASSLQLYPVQRQGSSNDGGKCKALGDKLTEVSCLEQLLISLPPERLQIVELVCTRCNAAPPPPPMVPDAATPYPSPGVALPFLGTMYFLFGPYSVPFYNLAKNVFSPKSKFRYGPTIQLSAGSPSQISDFPKGTVFHPEAQSKIIFTADARIVEELLARLSDFPKLWNRPLQLDLQHFTGNGLFTSSETSADWQAAHSILPRGFNQIKVKSFAPQILSKTRAFVREWSQFPAGHRINNVNDWLTAMTADAVVNSSMGLDMRNVERLGSGQPPHPFVDTFRFGLGYVAKTITVKQQYGLKRLLPFFNAKGKLEAKYQEVRELMQKQIEDMIESTRLGEMGGPNSIIRSMLVDKTSTGKHIRYGALYGHVVNLMIAGHETTAATLGFTLQLLAENPECEARALEEIRRVLNGRTEPSVDDVPKLQYVEQCFREALRLYSPVVQLSRDALYDTLLGGHRVYQGTRISVVNRALHTNPEYWGGEYGDPLSFNPARFDPEAVRKRHPNAYHPFGFGTRSCIGSQFALFEAKTFLASILLHFRLEGIPGYKLQPSLHAGGAAPSPDQLAFIIHPRPGGPLWHETGTMRRLSALTPESPKVRKQTSENLMNSNEAVITPTSNLGCGPDMKVLYGSNSGASQEFACQVASAASKRGFKTSITSLDAALPEAFAFGQLAIIVTSTYNGQPPDNAVKFKAWLSKQKDNSLSGLSFAVFGVGNSQWHTYQQFPREVDSGLVRCGAHRVFDLGCCDVDSSSFDSDFDDWLTSLLRAIGGTVAGDDSDEEVDEAGTLQFIVAKDLSAMPPALKDIESAMLAIHKGKDIAASLLGRKMERQLDLYPLKVASESRELCQRPEGRSVRHITLRLPKNQSYRAGDHLEVLPTNDSGLVASTLGVLGLHPEAVVYWDPSQAKPGWRGVNRGPEEGLWSKVPAMCVTASLVVQYIPDLAAVPSRKICRRLAHYANDTEAQEELLALSKDTELYKEKVTSLVLSLAELLERYKDKISLTIGQLVVLAKALTPRRYSVSSSPGKEQELLTVSVAQVQFTTGTGRMHHGLASTHLASLPVGGVIPGAVRTLQSTFHLPADRTSPILMVGPGTGVAPMMGFLQEREALLKQHVKLGAAVMFFGCRTRDQDYLYQEELTGYLQSGALSELHVAFSRETEQKVYVQDKIWEQRAAVWKLLEDPKVHVFVCGDARAMAPAVKRAFQQVAEECGGRSGSMAANFVASMVESNRYVEDVWAS